MNLSAIYTKTAEGLRVRKTLFGGLSAQLKRVLDIVDGHESVQAIVKQLSDLPEPKVIAALTQLEKDGYIKYLAEAATEDDWALGTLFSPMVVEEIEVEEALDFPTDLASSQFAEVVEANRLEDERKAREIETQIRLREKAKSEAEESARLEAQRIAQEVIEKEKIEIETRAKAAIEKRLKAERAKEEARARQLTEQKAREEAEKLQEEKERVEREAQALARAEEEARAQAEENEKARLGAERAAYEAAELQRQAEAKAAEIKAEDEARAVEERTKAEEARIAEELRLKQEAEDKIRIEAERAALEAEEKQRKAEETLHKAEIEAQAIVERIRAKEKARKEQVRMAKKAEAELKAAEEAQRLVELQAKQAEAEENARIEFERLAREAEEAQRQAEIEAQARQAEEARLLAEAEAEAKAKAKAKAKALADAEEKIRLENERVAREAEEAARQAAAAQAKQEAEAHALAKEQERQEKARIAREKEEEKARIKAENKARKEEERIAKKEKDAALVAEKEAQKQAAKEAKEQAKLLSSEDNDQAILNWEVMQAQMKRKAASKKIIKLPGFFTPSNIKKWITKLFKITFVYVPILALVLLGLMHFMPLTMLVEPIEKMASDSIGAPVKVAEVRASLWPQPHFVLNHVTVCEDNSALNISTINVAPAIATLLDENKLLHSVSLDGMDIAQKDFSLPLQWVNKLSTTDQLDVRAIRFKNVKLNIHEFALGTFGGNVQFDKTRGLSELEMKSSEQALSVRIKPQNGNYQVLLNAQKYKLPFGEKVVFDEVTAHGVYQHNQLNFNQVGGEIYGGKFDANALLNWQNAWQMTGDFKLSNANTQQVLKAFSSAGSVDGKLTLSGNFNAQSSSAAVLMDTAEINAGFEIPNSKINGIDIARNIVTPTDQSLEGYATYFDKLSGNLKVVNRRYQYRNLVLKSAKLQAQGQVDIDDKQNISGRLNAHLYTPTRNFQAQYALTGKVDNVKRK